MLGNYFVIIEGLLYFLSYIELEKQTWRRNNTRRTSRAIPRSSPIFGLILKSHCTKRPRVVLFKTLKLHIAFQVYRAFLLVLQLFLVARRRCNCVVILLKLAFNRPRKYHRITWRILMASLIGNKCLLLRVKLWLGEEPIVSTTSWEALVGSLRTEWIFLAGRGFVIISVVLLLLVLLNHGGRGHLEPDPWQRHYAILCEELIQTQRISHRLTFLLKPAMLQGFHCRRPFLGVLRQHLINKISAYFSPLCLGSVSGP